MLWTETVQMVCVTTNAFAVLRTYKVPLPEKSECTIPDISATIPDSSAHFLFFIRRRACRNSSISNGGISEDPWFVYCDKSLFVFGSLGSDWKSCSRKSANSFGLGSSELTNRWVRISKYQIFSDLFKSANLTSIALNRTLFFRRNYFRTYFRISFVAFRRSLQ